MNLLSAHLKAAAVSVVKKGFPVPAAKITTLPFSRCLTALLRIYGSATSDIRKAVWTLVGIPILSIVACKNIAFITVANILKKESNIIANNPMPMLKHKILIDFKDSE